MKSNGSSELLVLIRKLKGKDFTHLHGIENSGIVFFLCVEQNFLFVLKKKLNTSLHSDFMFFNAVTD